MHTDMLLALEDTEHSFLEGRILGEVLHPLSDECPHLDMTSAGQIPPAGLGILKYFALNGFAKDTA